MTIEQARRLKVAVLCQHDARQRLMTAQQDLSVLDAAERYIDATDQCFEIATEIHGTDQWREGEGLPRRESESER